MELTSTSGLKLKSPTPMPCPVPQCFVITAFTVNYAASRHYLKGTELLTPAGAFARPWMFCPRADFGLKGVLCPETARSLAQLVMWAGFCTDPDTPGTEKVVASKMNPKWCNSPLAKIVAADISATSVGIADPHSLCAVKGWTRMVVCHAILRCGFELPDFWKVGLFTFFCFQHLTFSCEALPDKVKMILGCIFVVQFSIFVVSLAFACRLAKDIGLCACHPFGW